MIAYRSMCWVCHLPGKVQMADNIRLQASSHTLPCTLFKILLHEPYENMVKNKFVSLECSEMLPILV